MTNKRVSREISTRLFEDMDDGILDPRLLAEACLRWMSEDEVREMAEDQGLLPEDWDEEEESEEEDEEESTDEE